LKPNLQISLGNGFTFLSPQDCKTLDVLLLYKKNPEKCFPSFIKLAYLIFLLCLAHYLYYYSIKGVIIEAKNYKGNKKGSQMKALKPLFIGF